MVSNGSGAFVGFNPVDIEIKYRSLCKSLETLVSSMSSECQGVQMDIAHYWASPEAVEYTTELASKQVKLIDDVTLEFHNVCEKYMAAAIKWAQTTGLSSFTLPSDGIGGTNFSAWIESKCYSNLNGICGCDPDKLVEVVTRLGGGMLGDTIINSYKQAIALISSGAGFIGAGQSDALKESVTLMFDKFEDRRNKIISEVISYAKSISEKYKDNADAICVEFEKISPFNN